MDIGLHVYINIFLSKHVKKNLDGMHKKPALLSSTTLSAPFIQTILTIPVLAQD